MMSEDAGKMSDNNLGPDLEFAKLLKCVQVVGKDTLKDVARAMYKSMGKETSEGTKPIMIYMENSGKKINFGDDPDRLLHSNIMKNDFDVTFAYKVIQEICRDIYKKLSQHCQQQMTSFVKLRNELCHNYLSKCIDIKKEAADLQVTLGDIYKDVANTLNEDASESSTICFDAKITKMIDSINQIMVSPITEDNARAYLKEAIIIKLLEKGRDDIRNYYNEVRVLNPCSWAEDFDEEAERTFNLETVFTVPNLSRNGADVLIDVKYLLNSKIKVRGGEVIPESVILQGECGSGKSTFCHYLVQLWMTHSHLVEDLEKYRLILPIEIRTTTSRSITEYLQQELLLETFRALSKDDVLQILKELEILFIIDGYDENNERAATLLRDIFGVFGKKKIIITTRTPYKAEVTKLVESSNICYLLLDLHGFDESHQIQYSKKVFEGINRNKDCEGFQKYLRGRGKSLGTHLSLPLILAFLIYLWIDNPKNLNSVTTATSLYHALYKLLQEKLEVRLRVLDKYRGKRELIVTVISKLLLQLGRQAWEMLLEKIGYQIPDDRRKILEDACTKEETDPTEVLSAFLKCRIKTNRKKQPSLDKYTQQQSSQMTKPKKEFYSFFHKTQLEYLASLYLTESMQDCNRHTLLSEIEDWKSYDQLLIYLTGNMALKGTLTGKENEIVDLLLKTDIEPSNFSYWWSIVSESQFAIRHPNSENGPLVYLEPTHPLIGKKVASKFLTDSVWSPECHNIAAAIRLFSLTPAAPGTLIISVPLNEEPFDIPDFIEAMEEVHRHFKPGSKLIDTELQLKKHASLECTRNSERFLKSLKPWAKLTRYAGGLESFVNFKKNYRSIKNISCKVTTPDALKSFEGLHKSVNKLSLTLAFSPEKCPPQHITDLLFLGKLQLYFQDIKDEDVKWVCTITKNLSKRYCCETLSLENSEISSRGLKAMTKELDRYLNKTLEVKRPIDYNDDLQDQLENTGQLSFSISWLGT